MNVRDPECFEDILLKDGEEFEYTDYSDPFESLSRAVALTRLPDNFSKDDENQTDLSNQFYDHGTGRVCEVVNKITNFTGVQPKEIMLNTFDKSVRYNPEMLRRAMESLLYNLTDEEYGCIAFTQDRDVVKTLGLGMDYYKVYKASPEPFGFIFGSMDHNGNRIFYGDEEEGEDEDAFKYGIYFDIAKNRLIKGHPSVIERERNKIHSIQVSNMNAHPRYNSISLDNRHNKWGSDYCIERNNHVLIPYDYTSMVIYSVDVNTLPDVKIYHYPEN